MSAYRLNVAALYAAVDRERARAELTWGDVARETSLSPSTFSRLRQGHAVDADALCALIMWLGLSLRQFVVVSPDSVDTATSPFAA